MDERVDTTCLDILHSKTRVLASIHVPTFFGLSSLLTFNFLSFFHSSSLRQHPNRLSRRSTSPL